jgi:pectin methylesterase-like acyl-CoA thioesterase
VGLDKVNNTADTAKPVSVAQQQALNTKQSIAEKGIANGYASLDGTGKVPSSQIPASAGSVWGTISGTLSSQTDLQTALDNKRNFTQNILYVQKTPGPHEFGSIAAAANSIVGATSNNRYVIDIGPGIFTEPAIVLPDWVSIRGSEIQATVIQPNSAHHVVAPGTNSEISFVTIQGATSGYAGIACLDKGNYTQVHKVSIYDCDIGILATASSQDSYTYLEYVDMDYDYTNALKIVSSGGFSAFVNAENLYTFPDPGYTGNDILLQGSGSSLSLLTFGLLGQPGATGIRIQGGGLLSAQAGYFLNYATAISTDNVGSPTLNLNGPDFRQCTTNLNLPSASTSGYLVGYSAHTKNVINGASNFFIADKNTQIVTVSRTGGDYTSVAAAVASITDASIMKQYVVSVGPGIFVEPQIVMKSYVYLVGCGNQITVLSAASPNGHFIVGADNSAVDAVYITGATSGVGVYYEGSGTGIFELIHSQFGSNLTHCQVYGNTQTTIILIDSCGMGADNFTNGIIVSGNSGIVTEAVIVDIVADKLVPPYMSGDFISVSGNRTDVRISNLQVDNADPLLGSPSGNGIVVSNGANLLVNATLMSGFAKGIWVQNSGSAPTVRAFAVSLLDNIQDLRVDHASATGSFDGLADANKVYINPSATYPYNFQDTTSGNLTISGQLKLGFSDNSHEDVSTLLINSTPMGLISGGALSAGGGFTVNVTSGFGYVDLSSILKKITWSNTSIVLTANTTNYIYFNSSGVLSANSAKPSTLTSVLLGRVVTNSTGIELLEKSSMSSYHVDNTYDTSFRKAFGPIYASGSAVSENATPFHLNVTGGNYFYSTTEFIPTGGNAISFQQYSQNGSGGWNISTTQTVDHSRYDDGSGTLPALTAGYFARHALYLVGDGANEKYFLVFSQSQYATQLLAETGTLPFPPSWISDGVALIASIIVQQGASNIIEIRDERPRLGFKSSGTSSSTDHEALSNRDSLTAHTQYLLKNGTDTMGGTLNMGSNPITNVTLINSIDITTHASRHNPGGPDALATGVPVNIADANAAGTGTAYARNDHIHGHGSQTNPTHHAIATGSANGFMSSTDKTKLDSVSSIELGYLSGVTSAIQGQINGIKATTVNGHPLSANVNVALSELSDVTLTAPALGNLLSYNGAHWVNSPASSAVSAGPGVNYFLTTTASGVLTYDVISKTPDTASEVDESYTANNNTVSMGGYITSSPPGGTQLDAGIWTFNMYLYCSSPAGTNTVTANVYSRTSGGIETLLFSAPSDNIINSNVSLHSINSVQPAYSIGATDNVVIKFTFTTTNTFNTTIHLVHSGSAHYSYVNTPLILRHNDLEALQGGNSTERFHLSNAEYVGSGTGVFIRQSLPFISAPVPDPTYSAFERWNLSVEVPPCKASRSL